MKFIGKLFGLCVGIGIDFLMLAGCFLIIAGIVKVVSLLFAFQFMWLYPLAIMLVLALLVALTE